MLTGPGKTLAARLASLEAQLKAEHPDLLEAVPTYKRMDRLLYGMGLMSTDESLATRIPWWPLIAVLGTFSSGKSTFINHYLGLKLQATGNQAVDDKFTVICYGPDDEHRVLPGTALDADPRFPFYGMSAEIDKVAAGEGKRIDAYLQLKTACSEALRGKILIDSPGFDADDQRRSTLRLTDHIIDLSDLVLVFFDARHPEPGAMQDTLEHLVAANLKRPDASKFLFILNQLDTTAQEDNPEDVVAAWQRAVAQAGLMTGRFFCIYNEQAAVPIPDEALRRRFEGKRDVDMDEIYRRIRDVEVQRAYRIVNVLEAVGDDLEKDVVPVLNEVLSRWRKRVLMVDGIAFVVAALVTVGVGFAVGGEAVGTAWQWLLDVHPLGLAVALALVFTAMAGVHFAVRNVLARMMARDLPESYGPVELNLREAFIKNTRYFRALYRQHPVGWGRRTMRRLREIVDAADRHVQRLNDMYTDPSGHRAKAETEAPATSAPPEEEPAATKSGPFLTKAAGGKSG